MGLSSLLTLRGLTGIPEVVTFNLINRDILIDIHGIIYLLATPSIFAASIWGEESMVMSIAFLL
ncbi:MAG: hypothetical protein ACFE75_09340, partial [Candidatus Hodarchaeota archaeon]